MPKTASFWEWLEARPGRTAVMAEWYRASDGIFLAVRPLLHPLDRQATSYPNPRSHGQPMKVVCHADRTIVAIDGDDWENRLALHDDDVVLYQLNLRALRTMLCDTLDGVNIAKTQVDQAGRVLQLGNWEPKKSASFPVYLLMCQRRSILGEQILQLLAKCKRPGAILLTPSRMNWDSDIDALARSGKMLLVPLAEIIEPDGSTFRETDEWEAYIRGFAQMVKLTLPSNYRNKKPAPVRASRATGIEKLENAIDEHLRAARDHAHSRIQRGQEPELLPKPDQKLLAKQLDMSESLVSRCLSDPRAIMLKLLWDTADSLNGVMNYKTPRRR